MPRESGFFGGALADLYARGMDISKDNPWALAQSSFPAAAHAAPGITMDELLSLSRDYLRGIERPPAATVRSDLGVDPPSIIAGEGETGGAPTGAISNPDAIGQVTGFSPGAIAQGVGHVAQGLVGVPSVVTMGLAGAKGIANAMDLMGLLPEEDLSVTTAHGPIAAQITNPVTGLLDALAVAMGLAPGPIAEAIPTSAVPDEDMSVGVGGTVNAGWTDTTGLTSNDPGQAGIGNTGSTPGGGPGSGVGPTGEGAPSSGTPSSGGAGDPGSQSEKRGGMTKGSRNRISPTKVHGQEFVMNARATDRFQPVLEAMNMAVPADAKHLEQIVNKARKFFDV